MLMIEAGQNRSTGELDRSPVLYTSSYLYIKNAFSWKCQSQILFYRVQCYIYIVF